MPKHMRTLIVLGVSLMMVFAFSGVALANTEAVVTTQQELEDALADGNIDVIVLDGTFDGFDVGRSVTIRGGTIEAGNVTDAEDAGILLTGEGITVTVEGVRFVGTDTQNGILGRSASTQTLDVVDSTFEGLLRGIFLGENNFLDVRNSVFKDNDVGIGGTENGNVTIKDNLFEANDEGIGIAWTTGILEGNTFINNEADYNLYADADDPDLDNTNNTYADTGTTAEVTFSVRDVAVSIEVPETLDLGEISILGGQLSGELIVKNTSTDQVTLDVTVTAFSAYGPAGKVIDLTVDGKQMTEPMPITAPNGAQGNEQEFNIEVEIPQNAPIGSYSGVVGVAATVQ